MFYSPWVKMCSAHCRLLKPCLFNHSAGFFPRFQLLTTPKTRETPYIPFLFYFNFKNIFSSSETFQSQLWGSYDRQKVHQYPFQKTLVTPSTQEKQRIFWSGLFSVFLFSSFILYPKQQGVILFLLFYYFHCWEEEESTSSWTDLGVNKKGFPNLWNYVQHVSYINIYLKYKSILLLLNFGFFYV